MKNCKPTTTLMNQKDKFSKEDGTAKVDNKKIQKLDWLFTVFNNNQT